MFEVNRNAVLPVREICAYKITLTQRNNHVVEKCVGYEFSIFSIAPKEIVLVWCNQEWRHIAIEAGFLSDVMFTDWDNVLAATVCSV